MYVTTNKIEKFFSAQLPHHILVKILVYKEAGLETVKYLTGPC